MLPKTKKIKFATLEGIPSTYANPSEDPTEILPLHSLCHLAGFPHLRFHLAVGVLASWAGHNIQLLTWFREGVLRLRSFCSMLFYMLSHLTTPYLFLAQTLPSLQRLIQNLLSREVFAHLL